jgi:hypothetical protein
MRQLKAKVVFYDEDTGKILDEYEEAVIVGNKLYTEKGYLVAFLRDILEDDELSKGPIRLLLYAIRLADYDTFEVHIVPQKAMKELGISETTFYRWLRTLLSKGYLTKLATNVYRLNTYLTSQTV